MHCTEIPKEEIDKNQMCFEPLKHLLKSHEQFTKVMERLKDRKIQVWSHCSSSYGGKEVFWSRNHPYYSLMGEWVCCEWGLKEGDWNPLVES